MKTHIPKWGNGFLNSDYSFCGKFYAPSTATKSCFKRKKKRPDHVCKRCWNILNSPSSTTGSEDK